MSEWKEYTLGDLTIWFSGGTPSKERKEFWNGHIPWISAKTMTNYKVDSSELNITSEGLENGSRLAEPGDILLLVRGSGLFIDIPINIVTKPVAYNQDIKAIRAKDPQLQEYLFFWLQGNKKGLNDILEETGIGAGKFDTDLLKKLELKVPSNLPEFNFIVETAKAIFDKIDLLHRQNATLEKMAETLFRQWFVEEAKEEWEEIELGSVIETTSGGTPSRSNPKFYENGTINWIKSKELNGSFILETEEKITEEALKKSSAKILPANSIVIAMYGATVGEYALISEEMTCNQAVCALKPNLNYPYTYLFLLIKNYKEEIINMAVGSAQQNISQLLIKQLPVLNCTHIIKDFHKIVEPYFDKIKINQIQIRTLTNLRDILLPKLMSGEVTVTT